ncbi:hypothetical protein MKX41_31065 [Paenibacillus sp. FSL R5-0475]
MIKEMAKKLTQGLEKSARKSVAREKAGATTLKVFIGSQKLPKELL